MTGQEVQSNRVRSPDELALIPGSIRHYWLIKIALFVNQCMAPASGFFFGVGEAGIAAGTTVYPSK
jgi:hypothetical protein